LFFKIKQQTDGMGNLVFWSDSTAAGLLKETYQTCTEKWNHPWNLCIQSGGLHFEGDSLEQVLTALAFLQ
jgi:hypothetical protein